MSVYIRHRASVHEVGVWLPEAVQSYRLHTTGINREVAEPLLRKSLEVTSLKGYQNPETQKIMHNGLAGSNGQAEQAAGTDGRGGRLGRTAGNHMDGRDRRPGRAAGVRQATSTHSFT